VLNNLLCGLGIRSNNAEALKSYAQSLINLSTVSSIKDYLAQIIHFQLERIQIQQFLWAQVFLLERQISNIESYCKSYNMMVHMWESILSPFILDSIQCQHISLNIQRIYYGFISQTLLINPNFQQWEILETDILQAIPNT